MKAWIVLPLLALAQITAAWAAPAASDDEVGRFIAENRLLDRLERAGATVRDSASELVVLAMGFIGIPYKRGGNSVETGFDCSGFVRAIYEQSGGLLLPRRANEQAAATVVIDRSELRPGDLVFFNTLRRAFSHVGIYVGEGKFIHSPRSGAQVRIEDMGDRYWARRFDGARRVAGDDANTRSTPSAAQ